MSRLLALYSRHVAPVLVEAGVANHSFLVPAPRPLIEATIRTAERLVRSHGPCRSVMVTA